MYINAALSEKRDSVLVWERTKLGRVTKKYPAEYYFYVPSDRGKFFNIYDQKVEKVSFQNYWKFRDAVKELKENGSPVFESDIPVEYKIISKNYYGSEVGTRNTTFFDIEVDYDPRLGFSMPENPYAPISAISLYNTHDQRSTCLIVPPPEVSVEEATTLAEKYKDLSDIIICKDERMLLKLFLRLIEDSDILSGWNSDFFDIPYVYERLLKMGKQYARQLSFSDAQEPRYTEIYKHQRLQKVLRINGRVSLDYLDLFKKFEAEERPSYALDAISAEITPDVRKLEYNGTLHELYHKDFETFVLYNIRDTEVLREMERKLGYMQLAIDFAHQSGGLVSHIMGAVKLSDAAITNHIHTELKKVVPDGAYGDEDDGGKFTGALVLHPTPGLYEKVASIDVTSLYPSTMRSLNISPEKLIGQFRGAHLDQLEILKESDVVLTLEFDDGESKAMPAKKWASIFSKSDMCVSGYGTVFNQDSMGFIPQVLASWFDMRKKYKKLYEEAEEAGNKDLAGYYYRLQYIKKIQLNSVYGVFGNKYFRFYDTRLAESTTRSGQDVLMHMAKMCGLVLDGEYAYPTPSVIYGDTDSCFFKTGANSVEETWEIAKSLADTINASFPKFMKSNCFCSNDFSTLIYAGLDCVSDRGIFLKKKNYMLHLLGKDGKPCIEMKVMGLQIKKTIVPKHIRVILTSFMERFLLGEPWKQIEKEIVEYKRTLLEDADLIDIGIPTGIKSLTGYQTAYINRGNTPTTSLRIPGHIAAAIHWNECLKKYSDKENSPILDGDKIKLFKLKKKIHGFKAIALPGELTHFPDWFMENFYEYTDKSLQVERLVDKVLGSIVIPIGMRIPSGKSVLISNFMEFA